MELCRVIPSGEIQGVQAGSGFDVRKPKLKSSKNNIAMAGKASGGMAPWTRATSAVYFSGGHIQLAQGAAITGRDKRIRNSNLATTVASQNSC